LYFSCRIILLFQVVLFLSGCGSGGNQPLPAIPVLSVDYVDDIFVNGTVESVSSRTVTIPRQTGGTIIHLVEEGIYVSEGDVICILEDQGLASEYEDMVDRLEQIQAELEKTRADHALELAMLDAQIKNNEAQRAITSLDSAQLQFTPATQRRIKELELQQAAIQSTRYERRLRTVKIVQQTEIRRLQMAIQMWKNRMRRVEDRIASLVITAPSSGLVIRSVSPITGRKYIVGDNAPEGAPVIELPDMDNVKVKLLATETDYKRMKIGDRVEYSFDAIPGSRAWGSITMKAPVGRPIERRSKVRVFEVEASVDSAQVIPTPGMSAIARIILFQLSDTLVVPQLAIFDIDSLKVVYIRDKKGYEERQVVTGLSSPKEAVITAGLRAGEIVSLIKPAERLITRQTMLTDSISN
jgi:HlyD family secretion protein